MWPLKPVDASWCPETIIICVGLKCPDARKIAQLSNTVDAGRPRDTNRHLSFIFRQFNCLLIHAHSKKRGANNVKPHRMCDRVSGNSQRYTSQHKAQILYRLSTMFRGSTAADCSFFFHVAAPLFPQMSLEDKISSSPVHSHCAASPAEVQIAPCDRNIV